MMTGNECKNPRKRKDRDFKGEETDSVSIDAKKLNTGLKDLISLLPEDILGNILSRLPTKLAASTSVLSKRWRTLFAFVDNLDFVYVQSDNNRECFKNFVDRTLALQCGSSIKKFSLKFRSYNICEVAVVRRWISNVLERGVLEMCLRIREDELPSELFRCKTLVKLSVGSRRYFKELPLDVSLPALKNLFIESTFYECHDFCERLLARCPVLEELSIRHVGYGVSPNCICSQTIKKLTVYYYPEYEMCSIFSMSIDAPNLVSLDYTDTAKTRYKKVNLKSLVEAKLDLKYSETFVRPDLTGLIIGISNVETLHLSPNTVNAISECCFHGLLLPVFNNLVNLSFGSYNKKGWKLLLDLLKQSPKLETLTIQNLDGYTDDVTLCPFQVNVLNVLRFGNTYIEIADLRSLVSGTERLELVKVEIAKGVVGDHARISRTLRTILEMAAPDCKIKLELS